MSENKHISIPKNIETEDQKDFHFLRKTGIEYIEKLGGKLWTDYNSHDPGITTLEVLSYAITDLGMRMDLNMEDILTSENVSKDIHTQFMKATEILPSKPLTELDYRKLFIDIMMTTGSKRPIRNCWLVPKNETLYVDCETGTLDFNPIGEKTKDFNVKGLYDLYVDYDEEIDSDDIGCGDSSVKALILERYHANRSLCEDLAEIKKVETQEVAVCARIGLVNKADEELVHAKVLKAVNNYLSPEVHFYSLKQMLDKGLSTDQIFEGPLLDNGFIDTEELRNSQLRREVRLSDIISEIMKIDGVKEIHEISIAGCDSVIKQNNDWVICIEKGRKPELCEMSSFSYSKGSLPLNINNKKVQEYLETLKQEEEVLRDDAKQNKELVLPQGTSYDLSNYASILNEFPDTYGVGISGIVGNHNPEREALAKQLKGYLLFFDQILAGYFKHLEKVKEVLSVNGNLTRTYFTQTLKNIKGFEELVSDYAFNNDDELTDSLYEELDNSVERRNEILDHLISRFAETFSDYTFLMKSLYGKSADEIVLSNKQHFLKNYQSLSKERGSGYNYTLFGDSDIWNTNNISGVQKRIAGLLGIKNYQQRNLSQSPVSIVKTEDAEGKITYTWKVKDTENNVILSSVNPFKIEYGATKNLNEAIYQLIQIDQEDLENALELLEEASSDYKLIGNIKIRFSGGGNYYFDIVDDTVEQNVMATHKRTNPYPDLETLKLGIKNAVNYFKYEFTEEGIFLIEHLLLKPTVKDYKSMGGIGCMSIEQTFRVAYDLDSESPVPNPIKPSEALMSSCEEDCEIDVYDPYSYRISVVLPGFAYRFQDPDFRRYAETVIRQEIPAHVLAKICWVGDRFSETEAAQNDLAEFETAFKKYLSDKSKNNTASLGHSIKALLLALSHLNNIYQPARLLDCAMDDNESLDGKIILGQSNIYKPKKRIMKLDNITTQYRKFNENQALTEGQLNEFLDYFEDQDRLSRTRLSGVGIACGFQSTYTGLIAEPEIFVREAAHEDAELDFNTIVITQGAGVTTDGDLITLRRKDNDGKTSINFDANIYKYYRDYTDEVHYNHFRVGNSQIPLLELVTQQEYDQLSSTTGFQHIRNLGSVDNKTVILYLESYSNEETPCQDADCDNNGAEQVSNLKVLLVDSELFEDLILRSDAKDTIYKLHNSYERLFDDLPNIEARRVILDPTITAAPRLKAAFQSAVGDFSALGEGFNAIADTFKINVNLGGESIDTKLNSLLNPLASRLEDYQYRYDLLKDLIDTYNEIKGLLLHLNADCCPSITAFPKHLMLGPVGAKLELGEKTSSRHSFYNSHITTNDDENYERIVMLANRFVQKLNGFQSYIGPVKITPSNLYVRLGDKAVPYYYNVDKSLLNHWNFEKTKTDRETYNLSYHTANLANEDFVQNPLNYNIDDSDFYRIEGHLGMPFEAAVQNINEIKTRYGLAFDVAVLLLRKDEKVEDDVPTEPKKVSIEELRKKLISISSDISKEKSDPKSTLLTLSKLDSELKLLNKVDFTSRESSEKEVVIVKEDPRKKEISTELLSEFLERKSGLEHLAGVEPGGTFVLICESEANNHVLADFSLPYLCCSKEKPNVAPIALDDKVSCMIGETVIISVMDNDYDADSDLLTVVKKTDPSYGTVVLNSNGTFTYTHNNSANLKDSFTYCVNDGKDDSNIATVFIEIKSAPVAVDDHASTENGGYVDIPVKDNDYDLGNTPLTVFIKDHPTNGTLMLNSDGTVRYQHTNPTGLTDSFTYYINDGEFDSNIAKVTITIAPPPCDSGMDVVFIFDYTGSMSGQIEAAKTGAVSIVNTIKTQSKENYRLGIVIADETGSRTSSGYQNAPAYISLNPAQKIVNEGSNSSFQWITAMEVMSSSNMNNVSTFTTQLNKLNNSASGLSLGSGGGAPEPTDFALDRVIESNFAGTFRSSVAKYVIIITDDVPGGTDDRATDADIIKMNSLRDRCIAKSIKVIVLGQGVEKTIGGKYIWKELANATGGSWNSGYNATAIETAIRNGCGGSK